MKNRIFEKGSMWENYPWEIQYNVEVGTDCGNVCSHCSAPYWRTTHRSDGTFFSTKYVKCPSVVVAHNEGHCNTTGVCLQCIIEAAKEEVVSGSDDFIKCEKCGFDIHNDNMDWDYENEDDLDEEDRFGAKYEFIVCPNCNHREEFHQ